VDPEREVLVTTGSTLGMYVALRAVVRPGDEVLIPDPPYDVYLSQVLTVGATPILVPTERSDAHFHLSVDALRSALTPRTRAIILNTPWNPTGTVMTEQELRDVAAFARENALYVLVDEIYEKLVYEGHVHHCLASLDADLRDWLITVNSFSKTYAMTGWRLGYNIARPELVEAMLVYFQQCSRGSSSFVQKAGVTALRGPQDSIDLMVREYADRRRLLLDGLRAIDGAQFVESEGTFFCLLDVRALEMESEAVAHYLVRECGLVTIPGSYYSPSLEGYLRISFSYAREDIMSGLERLDDGLGRLRRGQ
jgi:aspartate/methionine/tyrosine aminotransferase